MLGQQVETDKFLDLHIYKYEPYIDPNGLTERVRYIQPLRFHYIPSILVHMIEDSNEYSIEEWPDQARYDVEPSVTGIKVNE